ncbi:MAG: glycosyltransferase family 4 protein [Balneolaceae bacterium]
MKVAFVAPLSISAVNGGVRTQAFKTAEFLTKLGVEITFISPWEHVELDDFDIVHIFSAGAETLNMAVTNHSKDTKLVVSPVFFSNRSASIIRKSIRGEWLLKKIGSGIRSDFTIKAEICRMADRLLPNTTEELQLVKDGFRIDSKKLAVVPNGVEERFANSTPDLFIKKYRMEDFVLFVGHASAPRKNVLGLLKGAHHLNKKLVIIGSFSNDAYGNECLNIAQNNNDILLIDTLEHDSELLSSAYAACNTFVLPSYYETPGIAALEAALAGANIVITKFGGTTDYFKNFAEYLNPNSVESIYTAVNKASLKVKNSELKEHILRNYTWEKVAEKTLTEYKKVLA